MTDISKAARELAKRRKKPHLPFKNPDLARKAQRASVAARKRKRDEEALKELEDWPSNESV